jgi:hypothetical protein
MPAFPSGSQIRIPCAPEQITKKLIFWQKNIGQKNYLLKMKLNKSPVIKAIFQKSIAIVTFRSPQTKAATS